MKRVTQGGDVNFNTADVKGLGDNYAFCFYTNDLNTRIIKVDGDAEDGIIRLEWSELETLGDGVLCWYADNLMSDEEYSDGTFNRTFGGTTQWYIVTPNSSSGGSSEEISELSERLDDEIERSTEKDVEFQVALNNVYTKAEVDQKIAEAEMGGGGSIPSGVVIDPNYVHTDNNFTTTLKNKLDGIASGAEVNVQADWNVTDTNSDAYIQHKPDFEGLANRVTTAETALANTYRKSETYSQSEINALIGSGGGGESVKEVSVLWVGNSLTQDAVSYLPLVLKEIAPNLNFRFYIWYDGGATLANILTKWNNNTAAEIFSTCENVTSWTNSTSTTMSAFLNTGKTFDIVSIEEYFNYKRETGYTDDQKQDFNRIIEYLRNNYQHPFKVAAYFHRPLCKNSSGQLDLSVADKVYGLTYDGVRWQMENTIAETVIPTGIAAYRSMYDSALNVLGQKGYMTPDYTHSQEGLPCLMQAWVVALWLFEQMGMPVSINNAQTRVTNANYSSINVPGANLGNGVVVGTTAQDRTAMNVAIKAYKEGKKLEYGSFSPYGIPAYDIVINGLSGTQTEREVQLSASYLPADASVSGVNWSILSGDATVSESGLVNYTGSNRNASVSVRATAKNSNLYTDGVLTYALSSVETPIIRPTSGEYGVGETITITCLTDGAQIYYTTDGSTPTNNSTLYTAHITLNSDMTVKAIAYKDGENSNVATASYILQVPRQVSINLYDGSEPVSGATVTLERNGTVYNPTESSGGTYVFSVVSGTYNVSASAQNGELRYDGTISTNSTATSFNITLVPQQIDVLTSGHALVAPLHMYGFASRYNASLETVDGCMLSNFTGSNRGSVLANRSETEHPCTWHSSSSASAANKALYSLIEINQDYPYIEVSMTNTTYQLISRLTTNNASYWNDPMNATWTNSVSFVLTPQSEPVYLTIMLKKANNGNFSSTMPSFADMGLSVRAYKNNPNA